MVKRFIAAHPGNQDAATIRQFRELETYLAELERRVAPLTGGGDVDPQPVLDAVTWTELTLSNTNVPNQDGVFWASLRLALTGSNPNSWTQIRVTWGGVGDIPAGEEIGDETTIGNNDLISITWSGPLLIGINMKFWIRGSQCSVLGGKINVARLGTGDVIRGQL